MYHPITPTKERIEELRKIIAEDYGRELTDQEAFEIANNLLNYFNLLHYMDNEQKQASNKSSGEKFAEESFDSNRKRIGDLD